MIEIKNVNFSWNSSGSDEINKSSGCVLVDDNYWFEGIVSYNGETSYVLGGLTEQNFEFLLFTDSGKQVFCFHGKRDEKVSIGECSRVGIDGVRTPVGFCDFSLTSADTILSMDDLVESVTERKCNLEDLGKILYKKYYYHYYDGWYGSDIEDYIDDEIVSNDETGKVKTKNDDWYDYYPEGMPF